MKLKKTAFIIAIAALIFIVYHSISFVGEYMGIKGISGKSVTVEIKQGASERSIAKALKKSGVIKYELNFRLKMRNSPHRGKLNYGNYKLNKGMNIEEIIESLSVPVVKEEGIKLSVPEGFSVERIAARCEELGLVTADEFLETLEKADFKYSFIKKIPYVKGVKYKLQGYLFPSTYIFTKSSTAYDIIDTMLGQFEKEYLSVKNKNKSKMSLNDIIIVASLIEREAKVSEEREIISGVIQNRIEKKMPLQIDASVVYAISDGMYDVERVLYKDLEVDSPYNTYKNRGLPVGAICNPGLLSIVAAMNPDDNEYLYYRTDNEKNDGSHNFTETFSEHLKKG